MTRRGSARGVVGVFLTLLGAGIILDADQTASGGSLILVGILCLVSEWRAGAVQGSDS